MPTKSEKDEVSKLETTGHEWDGIKELNTPLPRWWLWIFYATIVWSILYWVLYPAWPTLSGYTKGLLGYSTRVAVQQDLKALAAQRASFADRIAQASLQDILATPDLREVALAGSRAAFSLNCSTCHGVNAAGRPGYPNLTDDVWLWGGKLEEIQATITHGARWDGDAETHQSQMPVFGSGILDHEQIEDAADFVMTLRGQTANAPRAEPGKQIFAEQCAPCHGASGEGNQDFGAPPLHSRATPIFAASRADIIAQITKPRQGVMPAWGGKLDAVTLKELTIYVHSLGGGR